VFEEIQYRATGADSGTIFRRVESRGEAGAARSPGHARTAAAAADCAASSRNRRRVRNVPGRGVPIGVADRRSSEPFAMYHRPVDCDPHLKDRPRGAGKSNRMDKRPAVAYNCFRRTDLLRRVISSRMRTAFRFDTRVSDAPASRGGIVHDTPR